jgi:hypothetical protein
LGGMSPAFVGFIIVPLVGAAAEMAVAFSAARKDRLDMSVSIARLGGSQIQTGRENFGRKMLIFDQIPQLRANSALLL